MTKTQIFWWGNEEHGIHEKLSIVSHCRAAVAGAIAEIYCRIYFTGVHLIFNERPFLFLSSVWSI